MEIIKTLIWVIQILSAITIVILVLLQHGKGADAGATFGSGGGSGSLFGASGSSNFLSRTTAVVATIFFVSTFALVLLVSNGRVGDAGVMSGFKAKTASGVVTSAPIGAASAPSKKSGPVQNQIPQ